jgi:hypothetical protein
MNTGEQAVTSNNGLLTTLAFQIGRHSPPQYALEGAVAYCGSTIQWLRDNLQIIPDVASSEKYALEAADNGGVYFVSLYFLFYVYHFSLFIMSYYPIHYMIRFLLFRDCLLLTGMTVRVVSLLV